MKHRLIVSCVTLLAALVCINGFADQQIVAVTELPPNSVKVLLHPWANEAEVPPERRAYYNELISIKLQPSGEFSIHLPKGVFGRAWCYITASGYEPGFLAGDVENIKKLLNKDLKLKTLSWPEKGVITGVTYHNQPGCDDHPVSKIESNTTVIFFDAKGNPNRDRTDADGLFLIYLLPGKYKVQAGYFQYEGAKESKREYNELGWIDVKAGETTILDLVLTTLFCD